MHRTHLKSHARTSVGPPLVLIAPPSFDATLPVNAQFVKSASPYSTATAPPPLGPSTEAERCQLELKGVEGGDCEREVGGETRRQKSLRIGVHHANAVVWEPV